MPNIYIPAMETMAQEAEWHFKRAVEMGLKPEVIFDALLGEEGLRENLEERHRAEVESADGMLTNLKEWFQED